jgi:hypothetical protein
MDSSFHEGGVVICGSGQAGSIVEVDGSNVWILLNNGDIWVGPFHQCRYPQDEADLAACPLNVERLESKRIIKKD